jgi:hypothetical protein
MPALTVAVPAAEVPTLRALALHDFSELAEDLQSSLHAEDASILRDVIEQTAAILDGIGWDDSQPSEYC